MSMTVDRSLLLDYGINILCNPIFGNYHSKRKMLIESNVQFRSKQFCIGEVGAFTYFGDNSTYQHVKKIGRFCALAPGVTTGMPEHPTDALTPHPMFAWEYDHNWKDAKILYEDPQFTHELQQKTWGITKKLAEIEIGNDVWIGTGAYIARGVKIGDGAVVGAHSVVVKDVPPYTIVGGVPAKPIKQRFSDNIIEKLLKLKWWDYGPEILKGVDITNMDTTLFEIEKRISEGIMRYSPAKVEFDLKENIIYYIPATGERSQILNLNEKKELSSDGPGDKNKKKRFFFR